MAPAIKPDMWERNSGTAFRQVAFDLTDMAAGADEYLDRVRHDAQQIIEEARREADAIRQSAEEAGRQAAAEAIERILDEKVSRQMKTITPALQSAAEQIRDARREWIQQWESSVIDLSAAMAARLVRGELSRRPDVSLAWVREALELIAGVGEFAIHLHPADVDVLRTQVGQLAAATHPTATVRVTPDESITTGGCRVVTQFGSVDLQIEAQLERIKHELS
ncbi:MAG TPA: FliH/SctL family protein [Lacipirellulaceae bacterium]|nr:FliH/SctL family protein [Lacipirellulaceae bacterium]